VLRADLYEPDVLEACPLVAKVTVQNQGNETVFGPLSDRRAGSLTSLLSLVLTDEREHVYRIRLADAAVTGAPYGYSGASANDLPFRAGAVLTQDVVIPLGARRAPPPRWAGNLRELYEFFPPGTYRLHFEVYLFGDQKLISNELELVIRKAEGEEAQGRERLSYRHIGFFSGRDVSIKKSNYDGRKYDGKVDVSRFGEIQKILEEHSDSAYAQWIRFWKLYHMGPIDDAVQYAREHEDFPLADNLMFRMAEVYYQKQDYERARQLAAEVLRDFPNGDTRQRAIDLQEKLRKKP